MQVLLIRLTHVNKVDDDDGSGGCDDDDDTCDVIMIYKINMKSFSMRYIN